MPAPRPPEFRRRAVELARLRNKPIAQTQPTTPNDHEVLTRLCQNLGSAPGYFAGCPVGSLRG